MVGGFAYLLRCCGDSYPQVGGRFARLPDSCSLQRRETRNLVRKAVVILSPNCGGYEDVEGGNLGSSFDFVALLESFAMLVDHRVNDVDEGLVGLKETMAA